MVTHVSSVAPVQMAEHDLDSGIDFPVVGEVVSGFVALAGWFTLRGSPSAVRVIVTIPEFGNKVVGDTMATERADVKTVRRLAPEVIPYGYHFRIHRLDLPPAFTLRVLAFCDESDPTLSKMVASIGGTNVPEDALGGPHDLSPLYVVGLGRSGTTALMRMFASHPELACGDKYPLELCVSTFHAKLARLGASFADLTSYTMPQVFSGEPLVGPNPFASLDYLDRPLLDRTLAATTKVFATTAIQANNVWYEEIARQNPSKRPIYFVEKSVPDQGLVTALNLYSKSVAIILVRDPRDIFLSRIRFNRKRGSKDFGEQVAEGWSQWADMQVLECNSLLRIHEAFRSRIVCVVRYEDLMTDPRSVLGHICRELGLQSSQAVISRMVEVASATTGKFADHRTSSDPGAEDARIEAREQLDFISRNLLEFCDTYSYSE